MEFKTFKIGDLFEVKVGGDLQEKHYSKKPNELIKYPIYSNSLNNRGLYGYTSNPKYPNNSITITGRGMIGHAEYRNSSFDAIVRLLVLVPKVDVSCQYVTYYINNYINFAIESTGVPQLIAPKVAKTKIKIPKDVSEQTTIALILSKVDASIEAVQASIRVAERLKKSLIQNLLTGKMKSDGTLRSDDDFYEDGNFGKVPIGWKINKFGDSFEFHSTASYSRAKLMEQGSCMYIHYGDIHTKFDTFLDVSKNTLPFISDEMVRNFATLQDGDLVMADASEDYNGVGKCIEIKNTGNNKVISGLHTLLIRSKNKNFINGYKGYIFNNEKVRNSLLKIVTGIKVYSVSKGTLVKILLPMPTEAEQMLISTKLDEISYEIQSRQLKKIVLERLKKSLMQNLLTGKVRADVEKINALLKED